MFLPIQTLPAFWAIPILILKRFMVQTFLLPDFQVPRSPKLQISRFPDDAGGAACGVQTLRSQLDPSLNAPRDQKRRKETLLRIGIGAAIKMSE